MSDVRVAVVDDHQLFAETMALALRGAQYSSRWFVPPATGTPDVLLREIGDYRPALAILDLDLGPFGSGHHLVRPLVDAGTAVLMVTSAPDSQWGESLAAGASGVVGKTSALHDILSCVDDLSRGRPILDPQERARMVEQWEASELATREVRTRLDALSASEHEILAELMEGLTVRDIARARVVSEATVRTQIRSILKKLDVTSQLAAVVLAGRAGSLSRGS